MLFLKCLLLLIHLLLLGGKHHALLPIDVVSLLLGLKNLDKLVLIQILKVLSGIAFRDMEALQFVLELFLRLKVLA